MLDDRENVRHQNILLRSIIREYKKKAGNYEKGYYDEDGMIGGLRTYDLYFFKLLTSFHFPLKHIYCFLIVAEEEKYNRNSYNKFVFINTSDVSTQGV